MYRGSSRNMQRVSLKAGLGHGKAGPNTPLAAPVKQHQYMDAVRIARVRRCFELEQEIAAALAKGAGVASLRSELEGVRAGRIEPPMRLSRDPRPKQDRPPAVTVADRRGPEKVRGGGSRGRDPQVIRKGLELDLADLGRGKVTLTGIALVKTLLSHFQVDMISEVLGAGLPTIRKVADSAVLGLAPTLSAEDGLVLVAILEERLDATPHTEPAPDTAGPKL